jgi:hypothetical protein
MLLVCVPSFAFSCRLSWLDTFEEFRIHYVDFVFVSLSSYHEVRYNNYRG